MPLAVNVVEGVAQFSARPLLFAIVAPGAVLSRVVVTLALAAQPVEVVTVTA